MKFYEQMKEEGKRKYREESKERLKRIYTTKLRTAFIGSLAKFEEKFGFLWGFGNPDNYTQQQREAYYELQNIFGQEFLDELWQEVRNSILHNGNNQIRSMDKEIEQYSIMWERYQMNFPVAQSFIGDLQFTKKEDDNE